MNSAAPTRPLPPSPTSSRAGRLTILLMLVSASAFAQDVQLNMTFRWAAPTNRIDGSALSTNDIVGYTIYRGTRSRLGVARPDPQYPVSVWIPGAVTNYTWEDCADLGQGVTNWYAITCRSMRDGKIVADSYYSSECRWPDVGPAAAPPSAFRYEVAAVITNDPPVDIILDDNAAVYTGDWLASTYLSGYYGSGYRSDRNTDKGKTAAWAVNLPRATAYNVSMRWPASANLATNVPVRIDSGGEVDVTTIDQKAGGGSWALVGSYLLSTGITSITVSTTGTTATVLVDALRIRSIDQP